MPTYKVRVTYSNIDIEDLDLMEVVAEEAPDAYFGNIDGQSHVDASINAASATDAVEQLVEAVHRAAPEAVPHETEFELVTTSEIADALKLNRETVRLWSIGKRGPGTFPKPVGRHKMWAASDVWEWLKDNSLPVSDARPLSKAETVDADRAIDRLKLKWASRPYLAEATNWSLAVHSETTVYVKTRRTARR